MVHEKLIRPRLTPEEAIFVARHHFGVGADRAEPLPSDRDQNFLLLEGESGRRYVLKLAHAHEDPRVLDLQNRILEHLARAGFPLSKVLHSTEGEEVVDVPGPGGVVFRTRLLTWLPGVVLESVNPKVPSLFRSMGSFLGSMDRALEGFDHPSMNRRLKWDLKQAGRVVRSHLGLVTDPARRALLEEMSQRFLESLGPHLSDLRMSVIHSDANDHNVLVSEASPAGAPEERRVTGLVDFGDTVRSYTVGEAAIAGAYAMLDRADPFPTAADVVRGYHRAFPLREAEVAALFPLMGLRLCQSVAIAAHQKEREPDNPYLTVSEDPAWRLLERLERESMQLPHFLFRQACDLEPVPGSDRVVAWLRERGGTAAPVVDMDPGRTPMHVFDLSVESGEFHLTPDAGDAEGWTELLFGAMEARKARLGVGRYDEVRRWYTSDIFRAPTDGAPEWRSIHMGVDLFLDAGSPVRAPFDGVVHSVADNANALDYGPTVILEHRVAGAGNALGPAGHGVAPDRERSSIQGGPENRDGTLRAPMSRGETGSPLRFWTLYGHLSPEVLDRLQPGRQVVAGQAFASIGDVPDNGGWAPHLHFQIITDTLGLTGDFPGVARPSQRALWKALSPDPNLILGIPDPEASAPDRHPSLAPPHPEPARSGRPSGAPLRPYRGSTPEEILEVRRRHLGPNLSVSYRRPLKIVRGWRQHLYDQEGQAYLDCVNNVPHVGHCHPRVVEAVRRQMAVLNTNTRYLHDLLPIYARRLLDTLPEPLSVVYFTNSGSEANELALRMARAHTDREDVVVVEGAYHGNTAAAVELSPYKFDGPGGEGAAPWVHKTLMPDPYRGRFRSISDADFVEGLPLARKGSEATRGTSRGGDDAAPPTRRREVEDEVEYMAPEALGARYAGEVENLVSRLRAEGRDPAAFFCEPLLGCGGQVVPPAGYLAAAFEHVRAGGGVCVADEVQVGFGRVGSHLWAFEMQDALPDIVTLGKPMGNGHPLGAVVTTPEIASSFATGMEYFNTFGGNPVSCAVGMAVLDVMEEEGLQENAGTVGRQLLEGLRDIQSRHPIVGDVRGVGLYLGVELVADPLTRRPAIRRAARIKERMREHHLLLSTDGPDENVLKIKPPLVFTRTDAQRLVETLARVLEEDGVRG
jgi:4-aminobutyrate aminotransferase-like enzyme/Ser/Thr protein kinase RdoA (MazF antagonist)